MRAHRYLLVSMAILWSLCLGSAQAQPRSEDAVALIQKAYTESVSKLMQESVAIRENPAIAYRLIEDTLAPHVDFELISRLVLGHHWRSATADQRRRFAIAFRRSLLNTYAVALSEHVDAVAALLEKNGDLLEVLPVKSSPRNGRLTVRSEIHLNGGRTISVDYRLHATSGGWKVYDLMVESVSFVTNFRAEYGAILQRTDLDVLISKLESQTRASQ